MGFLDRFRRTPPGPSPDLGPEPAAPDPPERRPRTKAEQLEDIEETAHELVGPAFLDLAAAEQAIEEAWPADDRPDVSDVEVQAVLLRVWAERLDAQGAWLDEGDYARVAAAFADLEAIRVVARMNFTCCQTCGHAEIGDERHEDSLGYTFFHQQDAERLVPGEPSDLFLAFGAFVPADDLDPGLVRRWQAGDEQAREQVARASDEKVAGAVVTALRGHGLVVEWDGTAASRICLPALDWRKRLPTG